MVETPGTAPGSDPLITSAFMSIVPKDKIDLSIASSECNPVVQDGFVAHIQGL